MVYHHDSRDYNVAMTEAAQHYRGKFEEWQVEGKVDAANFFRRLEAETPFDMTASTKELDFDIRNGRIYVQTKSHEFLLHNNAVTQMVTKTGILTKGVADKMIAAATTVKEGQNILWGRDLLLHNLRTMFRNGKRDRVLLRAVSTPQGREVRGFLSDKYRRMNSAPILEEFAKTAMGEFDAIPLRMRDRANRFNATYYHDTKIGFSLWLPDIFEPVPNEVMLVGIMIQNSDFGTASFTVRLMVVRIVCTNLMITQDELRRVHLGTRLAEEIEFSEETYAKDTETMKLASRDMTRNLLSPDNINTYLEAIAKAAKKEVNAARLFERLRIDGYLLKKEVEEISKLYNTADIELMPAGQNLWRASNAISLFANDMEVFGNAERAVDLRHVAGVVIDKYLDKKVA